jgi:hypothetical protein
MISAINFFQNDCCTETRELVAFRKSALLFVVRFFFIEGQIKYNEEEKE